ncbi:MAG: PEP-CTERM sorting domain-containing protein [Oceanicoccus sp.]
MKLKLFIGTILLAMCSVSNAATIGCGSGRTAELGDASSCTASDGGNAHGSDLTAAFTGTWSNVGSETSTGNSGSFFDVTLSSGSWGSSPAAGTWTISSGFWDVYDSAVISMHVGGGNRDATDQWLWEVDTNETSGTWAYLTNTVGAGGLSNLHLWGTGGSAQVPEPGSIALLVLGLFGLGLARKLA